MVFEEMQAAGIEADTVACGALFMVLNKGGHPEQALLLGDTMESRGIKYNDVAYTELLAACNKYSLLYIAPVSSNFIELNFVVEFVLAGRASIVYPTIDLKNLHCLLLNRIRWLPVYAAGFSVCLFVCLFLEYII